MSLTVPLSPEQIAAAGRLHAQFPEWFAIDRALLALGERFPDFGLESALLKVAALNQLYGTNVYAVVRMARHVVSTIERSRQVADSVTLVEHLALLPTASPSERPRRFTSFASKFCHFYVDRDRYAIYDSYAIKTLAYHLGAKQAVHDEAHPYRAFLQNLDHLRDRAGITCSLAELDRYLWLAGSYRALRANPAAQVNAELKRGFTAPSPAMQAHLALLAPDLAASGADASRNH
jgi:hypothetical protein